MTNVFWTIRYSSGWWSAFLSICLQLHSLDTNNGLKVHSRPYFAIKLWDVFCCCFFFHFVWFCLNFRKFELTKFYKDKSWANRMQNLPQVFGMNYCIFIRNCYKGQLLYSIHKIHNARLRGIWLGHLFFVVSFIYSCVYKMSRNELRSLTQGVIKQVMKMLLLRWPWS